MEIRVGDWKATYQPGIGRDEYYACWEVLHAFAYADVLMFRVHVRAKIVVYSEYPVKFVAEVMGRIGPTLDEMLSSAAPIDDGFITALLVALSLT